MNLALKFHRAFRLPAPRTPTIPDEVMIQSRLRLIREEFDEATAEFLGLLVDQRRGASAAELHQRMQALIKELCDLRCTVEGAIVSSGIDPDEAYAEVMRSNMTKLGHDGRPIFGPGNKVMKGPNYELVNPELMFPGVVEGSLV